MSGMLKLALIGVVTLLPQLAHGAQTAHCMDIVASKAAITSHNGQWIELTPEQWQFLRGIYAMNPNTPPGLPFGDKAALAQVEGDTGGLVFFIDGQKACTPMAIPRELIAMVKDVAMDNIAHESAGL